MTVDDKNNVRNSYDQIPIEIAYRSKDLLWLTGSVNWGRHHGRVSVFVSMVDRKH